MTAFIQEVITTDKCLEFNGYNTKLCREQGHSLAHKTKVVYLPLTDKPPAHAATMMTAMVKSKQTSEAANQRLTILTLDQQLYRVALHVLWENQAKFHNFYLRLGGMHLLMSYCGGIGTLMADTGIVEILSVAFGGVLKMLSGKKFPQNVRALRMLVEELLRPLFGKNSFHNMKMIPLFFAAGHTHYARYALYYLRAMEGLPIEVCKHFMAREHTMHHTSGLFNGIWTDMNIETTFMRYGHGRRGIVGITLKQETLNTWTYSLHTCNVIVNDLNKMRDRECSPSQTYHKEEMPGRIKSDAQDRKALREKIELSMYTLDPEQHQDGLVNVVTGKVVVHPSVNVNNATILTVTRNKVQLIDLICEDMAFHKDDFSQHKLVLTGSDPVPVEINRGVIVKRQDMTTTQEEADTMIVQQVAEVKAKKVLVVADDTDIFVLLLHFCCLGDIPASTSVLMVSPIRGRAVIDTNATVDLHRDITPDLLAAHGLTGCDTVATYFGIGKAAALRVLTSGVHRLTYVGDTSRIMSEVTAQATPFILACYGQTKCTSLTGARQTMWANKVGQSVAGAP